MWCVRVERVVLEKDQGGRLVQQVCIFSDSGSSHRDSVSGGCGWGWTFHSIIEY